MPDANEATGGAGANVEDETYRFPHWKDRDWNSYQRQRERYHAIREHLGFDRIGCEIGVYKGGFAEFLLPHCSKLFLVDTWYRGNPFWNTRIARDSRVDTVINILTIYKNEIEAGIVEPVIEQSTIFLNNMPNQYFNFIYIDSSHKYKHTIEELEIAKFKIKAGGMIFGDDYDPDPKSRQHGVFLAVNKFCELHGAELIVNMSRQWGLRLKSAQ